MLGLDNTVVFNTLVLPVVRHGIGWVAGALIVYGVEQDTVTAISGGLLGLANLAWFLITKPTAKALTVAKRIDAEVPASDMVVVKTPAGQADIVVHGK